MMEVWGFALYKIYVESARFYMPSPTSIVVRYVGQYAVSISCPMVVNLLLAEVSIPLGLYARGGGGVV